LKLEGWMVSYHLKPLLKSGAVVASGSTSGRMIALPGQKRPAKEEP